MRIKAAVLHEFNAPIRIEDVELEEPKFGEVRVKIVASGVCHSDLSVIDATIPIPPPVVLGHEGAGIVDEIGEGVTTVRPGDHVLIWMLPSCGVCLNCSAGKPWWCEKWPLMAFGGTAMDGTWRLKTKDGDDISHMMCQSSWAEYAVVNEREVVKMPEDMDVEKICGLTCGYSTGIGSVFNTAKVEPGAHVAIIGLGAVGMSALMAAKAAGAARIVAIDIAENKLKWAQELGATDVINPAEEDVITRIQLMLGRGVDYAFECVGKLELQTLAFDMTRFGGTAVAVGAPPVNEMVSICNTDLIFGKSFIGSAGGSVRGRYDIPRFLELYKAGILPLDKLVTRTYRFDEVNKAIEVLRKAEIIKPVLVF